MAARSDGQRLLHAARQGLAQPGRSGTEARHAGEHHGLAALGLQDLLQVAEGGVDGHVAEVEHGDILPGVEIFFHGPGRLDVGGFLHRRVKAHGETQRQDGLAAQIHRTFCDVQRQHPALRGLGRGDDRTVFEAADSLQGHELRVARADADAVKSAYPFFHSSSSSFAVLVWPSGPY